MDGQAITASPLRGYQDEAVGFLTASRNALLGDDPGLGKSLSAIAAADQLGLQRILIIAPAIARVSWNMELRKWQRVQRPVLIADSNDSLGGAPMAVIVSYNQLALRGRSPLHRSILEHRWDLVILDEAHYIKTPTALRTKAIYGKSLTGKDAVIGQADRVWLLSGTPAPNHAGELYTHVKALFPGVAAQVTPQGLTQALWQEAFCRVEDTPFGPKVQGSKNLDRLREIMRPVLLRRKKSDVLTELPNVQHVDEYLDPSANASSRMFINADKVLSSALPAGTDALSDEEFYQYLLSSDQHMAVARRNLGLLKVPAAVEWADNQLSSGVRKLILFAHHTSVIDGLVSALSNEYEVVKVDGRDSPKKRNEAVQRFQEGSARVFVGQLQAASVAITLTAASDVAMVECSFNPADNAQAISRAHRLGQQLGVIARYLTVPGTLDSRIMRIFRRKAQEMSKLFD